MRNKNSKRKREKKCKVISVRSQTDRKNLGTICLDQSNFGFKISVTVPDVVVHNCNP
jgi:hypothetical protein